MLERHSTTVTMLSVVTIVIGTRLQFDPYTGPSDTDIRWYRERSKQYARVVRIDERDAGSVYVRFEKDGYVTKNSYPLSSFILPKPNFLERIRTFFVASMA